MGISCSQEEVRPGQKGVQQVKKKRKRILDSGSARAKVLWEEHSKWD